MASSAGKPFQQIRHGAVVRKVVVRGNSEGKLFVVLDDVRDQFEHARMLEYDGDPVPFVTDDNFERIRPLRVEYMPDCILDVVMPEPMYAQPAPIPSMATVAIAAAETPAPTPSPPHLTTTQSSLTAAIVSATLSEEGTESPLNTIISTPPVLTAYDTSTALVPFPLDPATTTATSTSTTAFVARQSTTIGLSPVPEVAELSETTVKGGQEHIRMTGGVPILYPSSNHSSSSKSSLSTSPPTQPLPHFPGHRLSLTRDSLLSTSTGGSGNTHYHASPPSRSFHSPPPFAPTPPIPTAGATQQQQQPPQSPPPPVSSPPTTQLSPTPIMRVSTTIIRRKQSMGSGSSGPSGPHAVVEQPAVSVGSYPTLHTIPDHIPAFHSEDEEEGEALEGGGSEEPSGGRGEGMNYPRVDGSQLSPPFNMEVYEVDNWEFTADVNLPTGSIHSSAQATAVEATASTDTSMTGVVLPAPSLSNLIPPTAAAIQRYPQPPPPLVLDTYAEAMPQYRFDREQHLLLQQQHQQYLAAAAAAAAAASTPPQLLPLHHLQLDHLSLDSPQLPATQQQQQIQFWQDTETPAGSLGRASTLPRGVRSRLGPDTFNQSMSPPSATIQSLPIPVPVRVPPQPPVITAPILPAPVQTITPVSPPPSSRSDDIVAQPTSPTVLRKSQSLLTPNQRNLKWSARIADRVTHIQNQVQAVLTRNYPLREQPLPRLFLALPSATIALERQRARQQQAQYRKSLGHNSMGTDMAAGTTAPALQPLDETAFRLYFLCEAGGSHTTAIRAKFNHIHFVHGGHRGYEIMRPKEFFEKYGAFLRSLSQMIRRGVHCGSVNIPALLGPSAARTTILSRVEEDNANGHNDDFALDARLAAAIEYLDQINAQNLSDLQEEDEDDEEDEDSGVDEYEDEEVASDDNESDDNDLEGLNDHNNNNFDGIQRSQRVRRRHRRRRLAKKRRNGLWTLGMVPLDPIEIRQVHATYFKSRSPCSLGGLYRITDRAGNAKWICEGHFRATAKIKDASVALVDRIMPVNAFHGRYDVQYGRLTTHLTSSNEATAFFKFVSSVAPNLNELHVRLDWAYGEKDLHHLQQVVAESRIGVLSIDCCGKQTSNSKSDGGGSGPILSRSFLHAAFGSRFDPAFKLLGSNKLQALKISRLPGLINKLHGRAVVGPSPSIKAIHLEQVGILLEDKAVLATLLDNYSNMTEINLPGIGLGDEGVRILLESKACQPHIRKLDLCDNGITGGAGAIKLIEFLKRVRPPLVHLELGGNRIGDDMLASVVEALSPRMMTLNLAATDMGFRTARALEHLIGGRRLDGVTPPPIPGTESDLAFLNLAKNGWTTTALMHLVRMMRLSRQVVQSPGSTPELENRDAPLTRGDSSATTASKNKLLASGMVGHRSSSSSTSSSLVPELSSAEGFLLINSMISTTGLKLPHAGDNRPWYDDPHVLSGHPALSATPKALKSRSAQAQEHISSNSRLKVLRLSDAGLSEGAAKMLIRSLNVTILTKVDLRQSLTMFKPKEILELVSVIYQRDNNHQYYQQRHPQEPTLPSGSPTYSIQSSLLGGCAGSVGGLDGGSSDHLLGSPRNVLRFIHLNACKLGDSVAQIFADELMSGVTCLERLDLGSNQLSYRGVNQILDALCHNTVLQHLNLGQNFDCSPSATAEAFKRFMRSNKTIEILYFTHSHLSTVSEGLKDNTSIRCLIFDRISGTYKDFDNFGRTLAVNEKLMRFKVYDGRQLPFVEVFYGGPKYYLDPLKEFKVEAIKSIVNGMNFNTSLIEFQWPELIEPPMQAVEHVENFLLRNMRRLKAGLPSTSIVISSGGGGLSRSGSVANPYPSPTSPQQPHQQQQAFDTLSRQNTLERYHQRNHSSGSIASTVSSQYSQGSGDSKGGAPTTAGGSGGGSHSRQTSASAYVPRLSAFFDERQLALYEFSPETLARLKKTPSKEQQHRQDVISGRQAARVEVEEPHIFLRFRKG